MLTSAKTQREAKSKAIAAARQPAQRKEQVDYVEQTLWGRDIQRALPEARRTGRIMRAALPTCCASIVNRLLKGASAASICIYELCFM